MAFGSFARPGGLKFCSSGERFLGKESLISTVLPIPLVERLLRQSDSEEDAVDGDDGSDDGTDEDEYDTDDD